MAPHGITRAVSGSFEDTVSATALETLALLYQQLPTPRVECPRSPVIDMPDYPVTSPSEDDSMVDTVIETPPPKVSAPDLFANKMINPNMGSPAYNTVENVLNPFLKPIKHRC